MKQISILIVDDNYPDRYILNRYLESLDYDFKIVEKLNGLEAINYFRDYQNKKKLDPDGFPSLILFLDINMPLLNGFEFLDKYTVLKQENQYDDTFVMMFTTSEDQHEMQKALKYDCVSDFLVKSKISKDMLSSKIANLLKQVA